MTPDNAIIKVIKNRKFYTFNYDFKNKDMVPDDSNSDINIYQWSSNDMAKKTVKPNFDCVIVNSDDNLNSDELSYYTKIQVRVTKKMEKATHHHIFFLFQKIMKELCFLPTIFRMEKIRIHFLMIL